ncbi:MAG: FtsW/RodA/SpoVE family cell cycle protein [Candidatus Hydrogenedentes bacterium]|nr:FtsW/RodA/SpoVE family cell cycle protein [Candidatus Hydrogenedentota bacterium]
MRREASWLLTISVILYLIGIAIGYSVDGIRLHSQEFLSRQLVIFFVGLFSFFLFSYIEYKDKMKLLGLVLLNGIVIVLLIIVLGFGDQVNGAKRWIELLGGFKLQPSEFAKFVVILDLSVYFAYFRDKAKSVFYGIFIPLIISGVFCVLIFLERDLGTPVIIMSCVFVVMLYAGVNKKVLIMLTPIAFIFIFVAIFSEEYRIDRLINTIFYDRDLRGAGAQVFQAMVAYYRGGLFGMGLGNGMSKSGALPLPSRDFPFALWAEETGIVGATFLTLLFFGFVYIGLETAKKAPTYKASILSLGITLLIGLQSLFMMLVNEGWLPVKGMCIPFVSTGGSSFVANMMMLGCLVSIAIKKNGVTEEKQTTMPLPVEVGKPILRSF